MGLFLCCKRTAHFDYCSEQAQGIQVYTRTSAKTSPATQARSQLFCPDVPSPPPTHKLALRWRDIGCDSGIFGQKHNTDILN